MKWGPMGREVHPRGEAHRDYGLQDYRRDHRNEAVLGPVLELETTSIFSDTTIGTYTTYAHDQPGIIRREAARIICLICGPYRKHWDWARPEWGGIVADQYCPMLELG